MPGGVYRCLSLIFLVLSTVGTGTGQIALSGAGIPEHEVMSYRRTQSGKVSSLKVSWDLVTGNGSSWYEIRAVSSEQEALFRLDSRKLFLISSDVLNHGLDSTIRRTASVIEARAKAGDGELLVGGLETFVYELRGFPWGSASKAKLVFLGANGGGGGFDLEINVLGKEDVEVGGRKIACWKVQLGLAGVFGAFIGKTYLWYSADSAHYLVKSEGASGPPGSPSMSLILESYASKPAKP